MKLTSIVLVNALVVTSVTQAAPIPVLSGVEATEVHTSEDSSTSEDISLETRAPPGPNEPDRRPRIHRVADYIVRLHHPETPTDREFEGLQRDAGMARGGLHTEMMADLTAKGTMPFMYSMPTRPLRPLVPLKINTISDPDVISNRLRTPVINPLTPLTRTPLSRTPITPFSDVPLTPPHRTATPLPTPEVKDVSWTESLFKTLKNFRF